MTFFGFLGTLFRIVGKALKYLFIYVFGGAYIFLYGIWCLTGPNTVANYWHCLYWLLGSIVIAILALYTFVKDVQRLGIKADELAAKAVKRHLTHY